MNKLTKVVNIYPSTPITGVNPPIRSAVKRVTKPISEIRTCLMSRAIVEEILPNGKVIRLNIGNYDKCLDESNKQECKCCSCGGFKIEKDNKKLEETKTPWKIAYDKALEGKDLANMTRKQRRSAEAAARAAADAAVNTSETEVVMGVASIETVEEVVEETKEVIVNDEVKVEESVENHEEEVNTIDIETMTIITE